MLYIYNYVYIYIYICIYMLYIYAIYIYILHTQLHTFLYMYGAEAYIYIVHRLNHIVLWFPLNSDLSTSVPWHLSDPSCLSTSSHPSCQAIFMIVGISKAMTDPAGAGILMLTWLGYIDGIHGAPYMAAPWILWESISRILLLDLSAFKFCCLESYKETPPSYVEVMHVIN